MDARVTVTKYKDKYRQQDYVQKGEMSKISRASAVPSYSACSITTINISGMKKDLRHASVCEVRHVWFGMRPSRIAIQEALHVKEGVTPRGPNTRINKEKANSK